MRNIWKPLCGFFFALLVFIFLRAEYSYASELGVEPYIIVSSYSVTDDVIVPGEPFSLNLELQNADQLLTAHNVLVNVSSIEGVTTDYPSVPQVYIGDVFPNSIEKVSFSFTIPETYSYNQISFYVTITSDSRTNYVILSAPVKVDDENFSILSVNVPENVVAGEPSAASVYFRTSEDATLSNVILNAWVDDCVVATSTIGNMVAGASKTQGISFTVSDEGVHKVKLELMGTDSDGVNQIVEVYNSEISASQGTDIAPSEDKYENRLLDFSKRDYLMLAICCVSIAGCLVGIVLIVKKYK